ncbi:MAG TPA: MarR family transcriptional regulator [Sphingobacteriaceae bacterium]|nr:MarR family transcriptional regulator [Sphingobacteriaceae bacterium]
MELEKEILSSKFESEHHKSIVNLIYTYNWLTNLLKKRISKYHITLQQFNVLRILRGQYPNPATINMIKERMLDKMSDASRITDRLIQKGMVTRCTNQADRRAVDILISNKGLDLLKQLDAGVTATYVIKDNFTEADAKQLNKLLDKFRG